MSLQSTCPKNPNNYYYDCSFDLAAQDLRQVAGGGGGGGAGRFPQSMMGFKRSTEYFFSEIRNCSTILVFSCYVP